MLSHIALFYSTVCVQHWYPNKFTVTGHRIEIHIIHSEICEVLRCLHVHVKRRNADRHVFEHAVRGARPAAGSDRERHTREALCGRGRVALRRVARALRLERRPGVDAVHVAHLPAAERSPRAIDHLWPVPRLIRN